MLRPGDVVVVDFPGVVETKRRPAVVISTDEYHKHRPDVIVGMFTTRRAKATAPTDYLLQDWTTSGLHYPCVFRSFLVTLPVADATTSATARSVIGARSRHGCCELLLSELDP